MIPRTDVTVSFAPRPLPTSVRFDVFTYRLPLTEPLTLRGVDIMTREGALVRVQTADGMTGWGEAAPLPGFSREAVSDVVREVKRLRRALRDAHRSRTAIVEPKRLMPSTRMALEQACWALEAQRRGQPLAHLWSPSPRRHVPLNGLLTAATDVGALMDRAAELQEAGYTAVKLKVGQASVADDINAVKAVRAMLNETVDLRLDANRAWSLAEARAFADGIDGCDIAYIEEPLGNPFELDTLAETTDLPIALDETLVGLPLQGLALFPFAVALVLKPTLLGGFHRTRQIAAAAVEAGWTPVVSASFESGVGLSGLVALAASIGSEAVPVGLDTYRWLAEDVLAERPPADAATWDVAAWTDLQVDVDRLQWIP